VKRFVLVLVATAVLLVAALPQPASGVVHEIVGQWCAGQGELEPFGISRDGSRNFAQPLVAGGVVQVVPFVGAAGPGLLIDFDFTNITDNSVDVIFSNLCLQWVDDLPAVFAGFRRVLKPGGLLLCSTFGPDTLVELNEAFAAADDRPHVSRFAQIAQFGDALMMAGFRDPVLDRDLFTLTYDDLPSLMRELRAMGATNARVDRRHTLTGRGRFAAAAAAYEPMRRADGKLPSSWEVIYAHAWAPDPGAPIREGGHDVASVPVSAIPIRRKQP